MKKYNVKIKLTDGGKPSKESIDKVKKILEETKNKKENYSINFDIK